MTMRRRDALKTIGGLAGAASMARFLPACGDDGSPAGITTYVYLMMENRTYDHALGGRALEGLGGDGQRADAFFNLNGLGEKVFAFPAPDDRGLATPSVCDADPPHSWARSHNQFGPDGKNTGFVTEYQDVWAGVEGREPMKYMTRANLPITWALADAYTSCDRWFASVMGPTFPNRAYWHVGTSIGLDNNDDVKAAVAAGAPVPSIYYRLDERKIDWAYYFGNIPLVEIFTAAGPYKLELGPKDGTGRIRAFGDAGTSIGRFFLDAAAGKLPPVVYIDPAFDTNDDHPPCHPILGQELIAAVYTALAKSPQWNNIMLVVTYDEHGGYFDHVPPPTAPDDTLERFGKPGFEQLGFRVPTLVAGPYVKQNYVSSVQYDHTSALKHLQNAFGLEGLSARMAAANDLTDCIDLERLARGEPAPPIELPVIHSADWPTADKTCDTSTPSFRPAPDSISAWAEANPELFAGRDLRAHSGEYLRSIRRFLEQHGVRK